MSKALFDTEIEYDDFSYTDIDEAEAEMLNTGGQGRPVMTDQERSWSQNHDARLPKGGYPLVDYILVGTAITLTVGVVVGMFAKMLGIL